MAKKDMTPSKAKSKYRIRNWSEYNQSLVNRRSITFWFDEESIEKWFRPKEPINLAGLTPTQIMRFDAD